MILIVGHLQTSVNELNNEDEAENGTVRSAYFQLIPLLHLYSNFLFRQT